MTDELYTVLGIERTASDKDVSAAYRRLAKKHHPDLHPGDRTAEETFKKIAQAYAVLGDKDKRARYDRGEIDATGNEAPGAGFAHGFGARGFGAQGFEDGATFRFRQGGLDDGVDLDAMLSGLFGGGAGVGPHRGGDVRYRLTIDFVDAARGGKKRITLPDGTALDVGVPAGTEDGQVLRLKGRGRPGAGGRPAGDALVEVSVRPHPVLRREGLDIHMDQPVALAEAVLGGKVSVDTLTGPVTVTVPKGSNTGTVLRLKGKGIRDRHGGKTGDQYVRLLVMLPDAPDPALEAFVRTWKPAAASTDA